jgi:hypothetical protein
MRGTLRDSETWLGMAAEAGKRGARTVQGAACPPREDGQDLPAVAIIDPRPVSDKLYEVRSLEARFAQYKTNRFPQEVVFALLSSYLTAGSRMNDERAFARIALILVFVNNSF